MDIFTLLQQRTAGIIQSEFNYQIAQDDILIQPTRKEFDGEYTIVTFPLAGPLRQAPPAIAAALGEALVREEPLVKGYNVVKGFLNLSLSDTYWHRALGAVTSAIDTPGRAGQKVLVEFASPNTNKPLHLGHVRNILLGWSMSRIFETLGHQVVRVQIINDRGIAICKSMLAWQMWADGATPASTGTKPDHFVGEWYVRFEREFQDEYQQWQKSETARDLLAASAQKDDPGAFFKQYKNTYFNEISPLGIAAREMLRKWEAGDQEVRALWQQMNQWVYQGFESTYQRLGVRFDKLYYESETYLLGKDLVEQGLARGIFYQKEDGSVWVDLEDAGLDHKILLRSDGTSVYITQDLGTAQLRYEDFGTDRMIYVVADEQNYHFKALFETLKLLGTPYANGLHHLAYGMVDLPTGRMKTREGTVVDADDLMDEVLEEARLAAAERGEISELSNEEQEDILHRISLAALKYFIIRVDARKRMTFDPAESVDMQGQTGPYIQNAYVRIRSVLRKAGEVGEELGEGYILVQAERDLIALMGAYREVVEQAAEQYNPGLIANFCYQLAKDFHRYYHEYRILNAETDAARATRLMLITRLAAILEAGMDLLGIQMPERM